MNLPRTKLPLIITAGAAVLLAAAAIAVGSCGGGGDPSPTPAPPTPEPTSPARPGAGATPPPDAVITGSATYREDVALPDGAVLTVSLWDVSLLDAPSLLLESVEVTDPGEPPYDFRIAYDPDDIEDDRRYSVDAEIRDRDGELLFVTDTAHDVLTYGGPSHVEIVMVAVGAGLMEPDSAVTGTLSYRELVALSPDAVATVSLLDVSLADAPSVLVEQVVIESPGQPPIAFSIPYFSADVDPSRTYVVSAHISDGNADFITDTAYPVLTGGAGDSADVVLIRIAPPPVPGPDPDVVWTPTPAPVSAVEVVREGGEWVARVTSTRPNGPCSEFLSFEAEATGGEIRIEARNSELTPYPGPQGCPGEFPDVVSEARLGELAEGVRHLVVVNGDVRATLTPPPARFDATVPSPVHRVELLTLESEPPQYDLAVVTAMPRGSSCSRENGYAVAYPAPGEIAVTITHHEVAEVAVPCTRDYPYVETNVPLGFLADGVTHTISVNGDVWETLTPQPPQFPVVAESPVHEIEVLRPGEDSPEWRLHVVTGLPKGSTCSREDGYSVARPSRLEFAVVITHREIGEGPAICTADYPYVETIIPLGADLDKGETYTATVNRDAQVTFTPPPSHFTSTFTTTVESPIHEVELLTLESYPVQRQLRVVAGWPTGSGCSAANGYALVRPYDELIEVTLTHHALVDPNIACTADHPYVETIIPLGSAFEEGVLYSVLLNDVERATFTG